MDRSTRRKTERKIRKMMSKAGDNCSICGTELPHNSKTFGGITARGEAALAGECCSAKLTEVVLQGLYVTQGYEFLPTGPRTGAPAKLPPEKVDVVVKSFQQHVAETDKVASDIARRGGVSSSNTQLHLADSAWKTDDAEWFKENLKRSHRLRPMLPREFESFPSNFMPAPPPDHEYQIIVRQVAVGQRIRTPFCRNISAPIPDIEEIIHAIFDSVYNQRPGGPRVVTSREIGELAQRYAARGKNPN
jgi:hypothetical protein